MNWYNDWGQVSFGDEHINGILSQALKQDENMKLLYVSTEAEKQTVKSTLNLRNMNNVEVIKQGAKDYFENELKLDKMAELFPRDELDELLS